MLKGREKLSVLFLCGDRSPFGRAHLEPLLDSGFDLRGVVLASEERWHRFGTSLNGKNHYPFAPALKSRARSVIGKGVRIAKSVLHAPREDANDEALQVLRKRGVRSWTIDDVNAPSFLDVIKTVGADIVFCAAYPQILSPALVAAPRVAAVNSHPSLLPKFRGAHPHFWAIAKGAQESGLTAHIMTERLDDGPIVAQVPFVITEYTYSELYARIVKEVPRLVQLVEEFFREGRVPVPQDDSEASLFRNDREIHHRVFWNIHSAEHVKNLVRTEQAFCFFRDQRLRLLRCSTAASNRNLTNEVSVEPGTIIDMLPDILVVKALDGCLQIYELAEQQRVLAAGDWIRHRRPCIGEKLV